MRKYADEVNAAIKGLAMGKMSDVELFLLYVSHLRDGKTERARIIADAARQVIRLRADCAGHA